MDERHENSVWKAGVRTREIHHLADQFYWGKSQRAIPAKNCTHIFKICLRQNEHVGDESEARQVVQIVCLDAATCPDADQMI